MTSLLIVWLVLLAAIVGLAIGRGRDRGPLTLAYFLSISLIHVPGALVYLVPGSDLSGEEPTIVGFKITLVGLAAFVVGAVWGSRSVKINSSPQLHTAEIETLEALGWRMLILGLGTYFVVMPLAAMVPSLTAIVSSLATTIVVGLWLRLYTASLARDRQGVIVTLAMLPLLPLATVATGGFIGYGVNWVISVLTFLFVTSRQRLWFYLGTPIGVILGLSLFVAYMGERSGIRDLVWQQQASYGDRLDRMADIGRNFEILDLENPAHRAALDGRLNQNFLVGVGVMNHRSGVVSLAHGSTVAIWALIPRVLWPEKPEVGGGRSTVTDFTGITFAEGTSVGAGQVMEFYYNFGLPGVIAGFLMLGFILMRLDIGIMQALARSDKRGLLLRAMPGLTLLQPGGNLLEIVVALVGAVIAAHLVLRFERRSGPNREIRGLISQIPARARPAKNGKPQQR